MIKIERQQFDDGEYFLLAKILHWPTPTGQPFIDDPIVGQMTGFGAVWTEIEVLAGKPNNRLAGGPVLTVLWSTLESIDADGA
jgi:hypothetical protein